MSPCAFSDVNEIESGIHVSRELPLQKINHDAPSWRGLDIALAHRSCGIHCDHVLSSACRLDRDLLRHKFRALVMADHFIQRDGTVLVSRLAVRGESHSRDARGVNHSAYAALALCFKDV